MNMNLVADTLFENLSTLSERVYRNKAPQTASFPYVVFRVESVINTLPSEDMYVYIDIYESNNATVRTMESLADTIDNFFNQKVINKSTLNLHFDREQRQFVSSEDLIKSQMINLRYVVRTYFK